MNSSHLNYTAKQLTGSTPVSCTRLPFEEMTSSQWPGHLKKHEQGPRDCKGVVPKPFRARKLVSSLLGGVLDVIVFTALIF